MLCDFYILAPQRISTAHLFQYLKTKTLAMMISVLIAKILEEQTSLVDFKIK
jgi:hypothetical protein